jgi:predicted membrane channel-forming protein YqfA (hemolysin III family)
MGNILYTSHGIWLMILSIILLVAVAGCIVIALNPQSDKILLSTRVFLVFMLLGLYMENAPK